MAKKSYLEQVYDTVEKLSGLVDMLPEALEKKRVRSALGSIRTALSIYQASLTAKDAKVLIVDTSRPGEPARLIEGDKAGLAVLAAEDPELYSAMQNKMRQFVKRLGPGNMFEKMWGSDCELVFPVDAQTQSSGHRNVQ